MDIKTKKQRSENMSRIKSRDTGPELVLRDALESNGIIDFETHTNNIPGRPDLYFQNQKCAVFIDGCFWHACPDCFREPKTNKKFWRSKIESNIQRDVVVNKDLKSLGIKVIRIKEHSIQKDRSAVVKTLSKELSKQVNPTVLDLFAGAGGLSEGFIRSGYELIGHIEMDKESCSTLTTRMLYHALRKRNILDKYKHYLLGKVTREQLIEEHKLNEECDTVICAKIEEDSYKDLISKVKDRLKQKSLDIIVGGPPCQAYSNIRRHGNSEKLRADERNYLYKYYVEFLKDLQPKIFLFENVPGLTSAGNGDYLRDMRKLMSVAGYTTDYKILNAADYGVPQNRKRVILLGWRKDSKLKSYPDFPTVTRNYNVKDFFSDLPKINAGGGIIIGEYAKDNMLLEKLGIKNKKDDILLDHVARPNTAKDLEIYRLAVITKQNGGNIRYNLLPKRLKTQKNEGAFLDRFKVVDENAAGSHTIVAHIAKDGHYYIHPDLKQNRSLTVREAARLQTFSDDYKFEGKRTAQFRQIGNAVPPMFAEIIAKELIKYI